MAGLPHLQKVVNLGHCVQFPFLPLFLHFRVVFCVGSNQFWVSACQNLIIGSSELPDNDFFAKGLACVFDCLQPITSRPREKPASTPTRCGMIENMSHTRLERSAYFECVSSCSRHQSVMSANQNVLLISVGSEWYPLRRGLICPQFFGASGGDFK